MPIPPELVQEFHAVREDNNWGWRVNNREELQQAINNRDVNIQVPVMIMDDIEVDPERIRNDFQF
jgi:hypothetical protein